MIPQQRLDSGDVRIGIIDTATAYLEALVSHDADSVLLHPDVTFINNGKVTVGDAEALRAIIRREPVARLDSVRWLVDGEHAIAFYDLDADMARGAGPVTSPPDQWIAAYVGERFRVIDRRIVEIELVFAARPGEPRPQRPISYPPGASSQSDVLAAAKAYVSALETDDASGVPLADAVWRIENGKNTGTGADELRAALASDAMRSVQAITGETWFASGDGAVVFFDLLARAGKADVSMRVAERFRVVDGHIVEIEAVFAPKKH